MRQVATDWVIQVWNHRRPSGAQFRWVRIVYGKPKFVATPANATPMTWSEAKEWEPRIYRISGQVQIKLFHQPKAIAWFEQQEAERAVRRLAHLMEA